MRENDRAGRLFEFLDLPNEGVEIRPFAGIEFGVERFAMGADFEGAAARWDEGERRDAIAELENFSRQTDGFRRVVSNRAILDPNFGFHRTLLSGAKLSAPEKRVKLETLRPATRPPKTTPRATRSSD